MPPIQAKPTQAQPLLASQAEALHNIHNIKDKEKANNNTQEKELADLQSEIVLLKSKLETIKSQDLDSKCLQYIQ